MQALSFQEVEQLLEEVVDFLLRCGGVYQKRTGGLEKTIIFCLATGHYILHRDPAGEIEHFVCYWRINPEDIQALHVGREPEEKISGPVLYVVEHGNLAGPQMMRRAVKELRAKARGVHGLVYNHAGEGLRIFPRQKGA